MKKSIFRGQHRQREKRHVNWYHLVREREFKSLDILTGLTANEKVVTLGIGDASIVVLAPLLPISDFFERSLSPDKINRAVQEL